VARWLADRVGPTGRVVATDLDPRFLADHGRDNLDVWSHDIVTGPLEPASFDLVHGRAMLEHIGERDTALRNMIEAVRPGGWIVLEDVDLAATVAPTLTGLGDGGEFADLYARIFAAISAAYRSIGADPVFGGRLPHTLRAAGLVDVGAQVFAPLLRGDGPNGWVYLSLDQLGPRLVAAGLVTDTELRRSLQLLAAGATYLPPVMISAWGRRP
jgi:SAM-dependent methyltransferase